MKKIKYLSIMLLMVAFIDVKAIDNCTTVELNRLKELANNVVIEQEYNIIDEEAIQNEDEEVIEGKFAQFHLKVLNFNSDLRISYLNEEGEYEFISQSDLEAKVFFEGEKLTFKIYSYTNNLCTDRVLNTINIKLPYYNIFYSKNEEKCKKYSDYKYCKEFIDEDIEEDLDKIAKEFSNYIKNPNSESVTGSNSKFNIIYIIVIIAIIFIALILFGPKMRNKKKKRR